MKKVVPDLLLLRQHSHGIREGMGTEIDDFVELYGKQSQQAVSSQVFDRFRTKLYSHLHEGKALKLGPDAFSA